MDSDCTRLRWAVGTSGQCVVRAVSGQGRGVASFRKAAFSSCREALAARK